MRLAGPELPRLHHWVDETVVFDPNTGHTHLLARPAACLLQKLGLEPRQRSLLYASAGVEFGLSEADACAYVDETILALHDLGIVRVLTTPP